PRRRCPNRRSFSFGRRYGGRHSSSTRSRSSNASQGPASGSGGGGGVGSGNGSALADYEVVEVIGRGQLGDGASIAWKEIDFGDMCDVRKQMLLTEINLIIQLRHCNIVRCYNYIIDREAKRAYIIMEYCPNGDLAALIKQHRRDKKYIPEDDILRWLSQLALALRCCHCRQGVKAVLHRDLKPANCFLDAGRSIKLGDFGLARVLAGDASFASTYLGTPYYMSPEQVKLCGYTEKSDMWALGVVAYELACLRPPFNGSTHDHCSTGLQFATACRPMSCRSPACARWADEQRRLADSLGRLRRLLKSRERELDARAAAADEREARLAKREAEVDSSDKENNFSLGVASCADSNSTASAAAFVSASYAASTSASPVAPVHDEGVGDACGCVDEKEEPPPQLHRPVPRPRRTLQREAN
uniref:non-specific serine/threonine protein kinase n=1 Tax=Macrostomum lignano TaxID=282301 RepID=A0A1I8H8V8_9PLAT